MNFARVPLEERNCIICNRKMSSSSHLIDRLRDKYPNEDPLYWVQADYRCGYCKTRLICYPKLDAEETWDLFTGSVEKAIVKEMSSMNETRDNYFRMGHIDLIVRWRELFSISLYQLLGLLSQTKVSLPDQIHYVFENRTCTYFKSKYGKSWEKEMMYVVGSFNGFLDCLTKCLERKQENASLYLDDESRFDINTVIEHGQPHYSIYDRVTEKTVHCDMNELDETLNEIR